MSDFLKTGYASSILVTRSNFFNDKWAVGGGTQLFSVDTPLRALNGGITANSYNANIRWQQGDARSLHIDAEMMNFSDQNLRASGDAVYTERLHTYEHFIFDGVINTAESHNSLNENRLYFNPKTDVLASVGIKATDILYRESDSIYLQSLQILPGDYWQDNYRRSLSFDMPYEIRAHLSDNLELGLGGDFNRQEADGIEQKSIAAVFDLTHRLIAL